MKAQKRRASVGVTKAMVDQATTIELHVCRLLDMVGMVETLAKKLAHDSDSGQGDISPGVESIAGLVRRDLIDLWEEITNLGSDLQRGCEQKAGA